MINQPSKDRLLKTDILSRVPLLSSLSSQQLEQLAAQMWVQRYNKGDQVIVKGSPGDALLFILSGRVQAVDFTLWGKEVGLNVLHAGACLGELSVIDGHPRSAHVLALEPAAIAFLSKEHARALIYGNPTVAESMLKHFSSSIRRMSELRGLLSIQSSHQRLFALFCTMKHSSADGREVISNPPSHRQLACTINTSRETVSRAISFLEKEKIMEKQERSFVIRQPERLAELAQHPGQHGA